MWALLARLGEWLLKGSVRSALTGAGLGLGSAVVSLTIIQQYIANLVAQSNGVSSDVLGLAALSGVHIALSGVLGAIVYRLTVGSAKLTLMRKMS